MYSGKVTWVHPGICDTHLMLDGHTCTCGPPLTSAVYMWWRCVSSLWSSACSAEEPQLILVFGAHRGSGEPGVTSCYSFLQAPGRVAGLVGWKRLRVGYSRNVNSIAQLFDMRVCRGSHIKSKAAHLWDQFLCWEGATWGIFSIKALFYFCVWVGMSIILLQHDPVPTDSPFVHFSFGTIESSNHFFYILGAL